MKSEAPQWYNYVISGMDLIVEVPASPQDESTGVICTGRAYDRERRVTLESCFVDASSRWTGVAEFDQLHTAETLGHEACHIHTYEEGRYFASQEHEEAECRKFGTGAMALLGNALETGLDPNRGTYYFERDRALRLLRQYCAEGYRADLFCPTLQRLEGG